MQHGEEVRAAQELGAGRLEQQGETGATTCMSDCTFSPVLCNRIITPNQMFKQGDHKVSSLSYDNIGQF